MIFLLIFLYLAGFQLAYAIYRHPEIPHPAFSIPKSLLCAALWPGIVLIIWGISIWYWSQNLWNQK